MQIQVPQFCSEVWKVAREMKGAIRAGTLIPSMVAVCLNLAAPTPLAAQTPELSCANPQRLRLVAEILFGRDIGRRVGVSDSAWSRFVARELTPRFPDGLTVTDALGQWRDTTTREIVREPAKKVEIVLPGKADDQERLEAAVQAYKNEFHQRSVGVIVRPACVAF